MMHPLLLQVCLSLLNDDPDFCGAWAPSLSVVQVKMTLGGSKGGTFGGKNWLPQQLSFCAQILRGIQDLLNDPNLDSAAQVGAL